MPEWTDIRIFIGFQDSISGLTEKSILTSLVGMPEQQLTHWITHQMRFPQGTSSASVADKDAHPSWQAVFPVFLFMAFNVPDVTVLLSRLSQTTKLEPCTGWVARGPGPNFDKTGWAVIFRPVQGCIPNIDLSFWKKSVSKCSCLWA